MDDNREFWSSIMNLTNNTGKFRVLQARCFAEIYRLERINISTPSFDEFFCHYIIFLIISEEKRREIKSITKARVYID